MNEIRLRTKGHPEANERKPKRGEQAFTFTFPLESGNTLHVEGGKEDFERFSEMLGSMAIDDAATEKEG